MKPRVVPFGESALLVELGDEFQENIVGWARGIADYWETVLNFGPAVPAYASALLRFDPLKTAPAEAEKVAEAMLARGQFMLIAGNKPRRLIEIPTTYDGPDLADTAERSHLSVEQLIALHAEREYTAYFLGFLPGTAYCGRLDPRIVAPRLERPRERVPAGSVAVADGQTIVYPLASPGGWRLIGRTALTMFDPALERALSHPPGRPRPLRSAVIRISEAAVRSTVQDRGRFGHLRSGVPPGGAADRFALAAANALVGNADDAAGIEIIGTTFRFSCDDARVVAVAGRDVSLSIRTRLPGWSSVFVRSGQTVTVHAGERTRFAYLAVSGGIATPQVLGSRATYLPAGLGAPLRAGDALPLGDADAGAEDAGRGVEPTPYDGQVRAMAGPHTDRFDADAMRRFFAGTFLVEPASDRQGTRLGGVPIAPRAGELLSCGVLAGAVQVPRGGAPIVLLADHQTTGGYPVIATVISADLGKVVQSLPGESLRFYRVDRDEALEALRGEWRALDGARVSA